MTRFAEQMVGLVLVGNPGWSLARLARPGGYLPSAPPGPNTGGVSKADVISAPEIMRGMLVILGMTERKGER